MIIVVVGIGPSIRAARTTRASRNQLIAHSWAPSSHPHPYCGLSPSAFKPDSRRRVSLKSHRKCDRRVFCVLRFVPRDNLPVRTQTLCRILLACVARDPAGFTRKKQKKGIG